MLLDIDGTLAPIVEHAADASVPETTRQLMISISRRYGLLACISGRRASEARAMVSIGTIAYLGSHGAELLRSGWTEAQLDPALAEWSPRVDEFRRESDTPELRRRRVRIEDKGPIIAYHWRGAADEQDARAAIDAIAQQAQADGLEVSWGRKVMEVRPPVRIDKGLGRPDRPRRRTLHRSALRRRRCHRPRRVPRAARAPAGGRIEHAVWSASGRRMGRRRSNRRPTSWWPEPMVCGELLSALIAE